MAGTMSKAPLVVTLFLTIAAGGALLAGQGPGRGGSPTDANGECPAGMTEIRPGNCQAPSQPPPSIVDYRPEVDAGHRAAPGAEGEVPGHRHPRPPGQPVDRRGHHPRRHGHGRAQHQGPGQRRQPHGRAPQGDARRHRRQPAQGSLPRPVRHRLRPGRAGLGRAGGQAARGRRRRRRGRRRRDLQGLRAEHPEGRRLAPEGRRSRARSDLAGGGAARHPGLHPHRRAAGVLRAARLPQRALAGAGALPRPRRHRDARRDVRGARRRAQPPVRAQPEDALHRRALRLARQRPGQGLGDARRLPERRHRGRRDPLRHRPPAARRARLLRQVPGPHPVREGLVPAGRISVLLARVRDQGRGTSTTTATTTPSGSCTASTCRTRC